MLTFALRRRLSLKLIVLTTLLVLSIGCGAYDSTGYIDEQGQYAPPTNDDAYANDENSVEDDVTRDDDYGEFEENEFVDASEDDTSTFASDVSTASYTLMRRDLNSGRLPDPAGVRIEEYINFFDYDYAQPDGDDLFSVDTEIGPSHFGTTEDQDRKMMRIGLQGRDVSIEDMKQTNLVFLVDVSGSMGPDNRLPLAKDALQVMLEHLRDGDTVGIQTYASSSETVLEPTDVEHRGDIEAAIDSLEAGGATFGEGGITDAYNMAEDAFIEDGNNRVVILTDGDFNVGKTGDDLIDMVRSYRDDYQISLTSAGFGHGGFNDATMERLAREGNGNYFYIDSREEAYRVFGSQLPSTVQVLAHGVRNQVEFNPDIVDRYRLVGYEKRLMDDDDFDDADANAGEIGPGHDVTAFYELELHDDIDDIEEPLSTVNVAHKRGYNDELEFAEFDVTSQDIRDSFDDLSGEFQFAAAVTQYAGILRQSDYVYDDDFQEVISVASAQTNDDERREEFLDLVEIADNLWE